MPRRREVPKREILPDPVYNSQLVTKFINSLMTHGKKSVAENVFYGALKKVEDGAKDDPLKLFKKAVDNVKPALEVKSRRVGGSNYQVPIEVRPTRRTALAIRWLISYAQSRGEKTTWPSARPSGLPASNRKLFTAATVANCFGFDHQFTTELAPLWFVAGLVIAVL